jgi:hypothetical protein
MQGKVEMFAFLIKRKASLSLWFLFIKRMRMDYKSARTVSDSRNEHQN